MKITGPTVAAALMLSGCAGADGLTPRQEANLHALANARPDGPAVTCIPLSNIRHAVARDDRTVDFQMSDGRVLRNRLPQACPGLAFQDSFLYRTSIDRLCSVDTITVFRQVGPSGPTCGLGAFQPVRIAPR